MRQTISNIPIVWRDKLISSFVYKGYFQVAAFKVHSLCTSKILFIFFNRPLFHLEATHFSLCHSLFAQETLFLIHMTHYLFDMLFLYSQF